MIKIGFQSIEGVLEATVPNGWTKRRLGDPEVATIIMGQSPSSSTYNTSGKGLPFFQGKTDFGLRHPVPSKWCSEPNRIAEQGDVLVSVRAPVGDANIATDKCCIGRGIAAIRKRENTDQGFLFYLLLHHKSDLDRLGSGAIFKAINKDVLYDFEVILPPLQEQKAIAVILSKIQDAIETEEKVIAKLKELKYTTMAKLFREGLYCEPLKQTEIGEMPANWTLRTIASLGDLVTGTTPPTKKPEYYSGEVPFISPGDMGQGRIIRGTQKCLSQEGVAVSRPLPSRAVLVVCIGSTIGKVGMTNAKINCTNQQINAIICNESVYPEFVYYLMVWNTDRIRNLSTPSPVPILNKGAFGKGIVALPSDQREQEKIANVLCAIDDRIEIVEKKHEECKLLFSSILHLLMTGQIRINGINIKE